VLRVAADQPRPLLRLVPISSGIYAGPFRGSAMTSITADALRAAFDKLEPQRQKALAPHNERRIELCIYDPKEVSEYRQAIKHVFAPPDPSGRVAYNKA